MPTETVDMLSFAEDVKALLEKSAAEKVVSILVKGEGFSIEGVSIMLHEAIYNLCDNAIKYNVIGGSVEIEVQDMCLTVRDTGIGISAEQ